MEKTKDYEVVKLNSIYQECSIWDSLINVTAWSNGEGFDLAIASKNGGMQHISITYSEFDIIKKCVNKLDGDYETDFDDEIINSENDLEETTNSNNVLEEVLGSSFCEFSVIENKLAVLYRNQVKIFNEIKKLKIL